MCLLVSARISPPPPAPSCLRFASQAVDTANSSLLRHVFVQPSVTACIAAVGQDAFQTMFPGVSFPMVWWLSRPHYILHCVSPQWPGSTVFIQCQCFCDPLKSRPGSGACEKKRPSCSNRGAGVPRAPLKFNVGLGGRGGARALRTKEPFLSRDGGRRTIQH